MNISSLPKYPALQEPSSAARSEGAGPKVSPRVVRILRDLALLAAIAALFYFLMIAPMKRQEKQRQALVSTLKRNDKIINSGGIIGIVESVKEKENEVVLKGGLRVTKASIVQVVTEDAPKEQKEGS